MADWPVLLVVEDDEDIRDLLVTSLSSGFYHVLSAGDGERASVILQAEKIDLALVDLQLPGRVGGRELAQRAAARGAAVMILSGAAAAASDLPYPRLNKPVRLKELAVAVEAALRRSAG